MQKPSTLIGALAIVGVIGATAATGAVGVMIGRRMERSQLCCQIQPRRAFVLGILELLGVKRFYGQVAQDKWVLETAFPGVTDGFFVDVGSGDGTLHSNTRALEERGWTGLCIDPFPTNMDERTCEVFRSVVYSEAGQSVTFRAAGELGGIEDTLGRWRDATTNSELVTFTTVTLADLFDEATVPPFVHFMSLDVEGAELEVLRGLQFDRYRIGSLAVEHNFEEPKRSDILRLMEDHGYVRVHIWQQDDFYRPRDPR
jgi:FkbM family methyltransferase